jgi:ribosome biogenesis protein ERB1
MPKPISAPKKDSAGHAESYNPPEEYLLDEEEKKELEELDDEDKPYDFEPKKFDSLRKVTAYDKLADDHFKRCLDLYICPRVQKNKLDIDPNSLIPEIPLPSDFKPFPTKISIDYIGHKACIRSISVSPCGRFLASGDDIGKLIIWDVETSRQLRTYDFENVVDDVEWNPNPEMCLLGVANEYNVLIINPRVYGKKISDQTDLLLKNVS